MKAAAKVLLDRGYCDEIFATHADGTICIDNEEWDDWQTLEPFTDTLNGRRQFDVLLGNWLITTIHDCEVDGWWVECFRLAMWDKKENRAIVSYPVLYDPKYKLQAEYECVIGCLKDDT